MNKIIQIHKSLHCRVEGIQLHPHCALVSVGAGMLIHLEKGMSV